MIPRKKKKTFRKEKGITTLTVLHLFLFYFFLLRFSKASALTHETDSNKILRVIIFKPFIL